MTKRLLINLPASFFKIFSEKFFNGIQYIVCLSLFILIAQTSFAQDDDDDPDMPKFSKGKITTEEFMKLRAEAIGMRRGVEKNKPFDPTQRSRAIRQLEQQKVQFSSHTQSPQVNALLSSTWTEIGPKPIPNGQVQSGSQMPVSGRTVAIAVHPTNPNIVYVGTAQGGLYRSLDGGNTWVPLLDGALSLAVGAVAIAPSQPNTIFVGTGESGFSADSYFGVGIYRIDNANSATPTITGPIGGSVFTGRSISKIVVHPTDPNIIFAASSSGIGGISGTANNVLASRGIFRSTDALSASPTFTKLTITGPSAQDRAIVDIVMDPGNPDLVLCTLADSFNAGEGGIYRSTNALSATPSFVRTFTAGVGTTLSRTELALNRTGGVVTVYAASGFNGGTVQRSVDGGATWTQRIDNNFCGGQCFYNIAIDVDPTNADHVFLGGTGATTTFAISNDGGTTFTNSQDGLHTDSHVITVAPSSPSTIYFGSDGGIYKSTNGGITWVSMNNTTFRATQFVSLAVHPVDQNFTIGGTQDNGTNFYQPAGTWTRADFGDGGYSLIDQGATDNINVRMYHTYFNNTTLKGYATVSNTGSATEGNWVFRGCNGIAGNGIPCGGTVLFYAPIEQGPGTPNTVYYGANILYRSADAGLNHTAVSQNLTNPISAIGISPQNDNVRIVGQNTGGIFGTTTGSTTLTNLDLSNTVPNNFIARAVIDPNNVNTAYVTLSAFGVVNVWKTVNLNNAAPTWTSAASGIPQVPVNAFIVDPSNSNYLYAGTDIGVYVSTDGGASWVPFGTGLPVVAVFDMAIQKIAGKLRIATHGRGMWEIPVAAALPYIVAAGSTLSAENCTPTNGAIDPGETVTVSFCIKNTGAGSTTNLVGTLQNTGGVSGASGPYSYGAVAPGATACGPFTFTANGACGSTITASIQLQDGSTDLGTVTYTFTLGAANVATAYSEAFDGVVAPSLPVGWTTTHTGAEVDWITSATNSNTAPNNAFAPDADGIGNTELVSPSISVPAIGGRLTFKNLYNMESGYDGMVLEISINGGTFSDITSGGNTFITGGYNSIIDAANANNPLQGRNAWSGLSDGTTAVPAYVTSSINLPAAAAGQSIKLKWRAASDENTVAAGAAGVRIDDISISNTSYSCCTAPVIVNYYVNDTYDGAGIDIYTTAAGNDGNPGTSAAPFRTIQHAVGAASAGSTIFVDHGTFVEQVSVNKSLTITGAASSGVSQTTIKAPASLVLVSPAPNGQNHKVIVYASGAGNTINISKVAVDGDGRGGGPDQFDGVYYFEASGSFSDSRIIKIRDASFSGVQSGIAFHANHTYDQTLAQTVTVNNNSITDYQKAGIVINELNTQAIVTNNTITGQNIENVNGQIGIQFGFGAYGTITGNTVTNNTYNGANTDDAAGILLAGVGVDFNDAATGNATTVGGAGVLANVINNNEVGLLTDAGGYGYEHNAGIIYGANSFANNLIHVYHDHPASVPSASFTYDKRVDNTSQTNIVYGQIQRAVNEATAGNILNASAGTFIEQVEIPKALTLNGAGVGVTNINSPAVLALSYTIAPSPTIHRPIVYVHDAAGVIFKNITVNGLGNGNANNRFQGIAYRNAGGTIQDCEVKAIRNNPLDGVQAGVSVYASATDGNARTLNVTHNTLTDFQKNGTVFSGANLTVNFDNNTVTGAGSTTLIGQNGVQVSGGAGGTISNNAISGLNYTPNTAVSTGVLVFGPGTVQTSGNTVNDAQVSIYYIDASGSIANNIVNVTAANMGATPYWYGIVAENGTVSITGNEVNGGGNGAGIEADAVSGETTTLTATNNKIANTDEGFVIFEDGTGVVNSTINNNSITGSVSKAIHNYGITNSAATCNWYGTTDAAAIAAQISGPVTYVPFLTNGTDAAPATPGFQPVPNSCNGSTICESPETLAYTSNTQSGNQPYKGELGMEFIVNAPGGIMIKQLGAFDDGGNGITGLQPGGGVRVAIFNRNTHLMVPGLDVTISGTGDDYKGFHRMKNLTSPINLPQGDYVIVAKGYHAGERNGNSFNGGALYPAGNNGGGAITFGNETSYGPDDPNGFNYPTSALTLTDTHVFLAGTFDFTTVVPCSPSTECESPAVQAYTSNTTAGNQAHRGELGLEFTVNNSSGIIVKQLGAFDDGANGISGLQPGGGVRVAIFNRATHTIVPGLDATVIGTSDPLIGNHRMKNITPVTLPPGDYVVVAKGYNAAERNGNSFEGGGPYPSGNTNGGAVTYSTESSYGPDDPNGFNYPASAITTGDAHLFLAGSFNFSTPLPCGPSCESGPTQAYSSNTTTGNQAHRGELGMQFIVNNAAGIKIKQLGAFDDGGLGITGLQPGGGVRVAIFNRATQTVVPGLDVIVIGNADQYTGNHRMKDIPPVTLPPGDYVIVAKGYHIGERNGNVGNGGGPYPTDNGGGAITFGNESSYGPDDPNGFTYPSTAGNFGSVHQFLAGTFKFTVEVACPTAPEIVSLLTPTAAKPELVKQQVTGTSPVLSVKTKDLKIYPDPTKGQFNVQLSNVSASKIVVQIINSNGKLVEQRTIGSASKNASLTIPFDLVSQPSGVYLVKVISDDGIRTEKLVIQR